MILTEKLKKIIAELTVSGVESSYIKTSLKEYLQSYVLNFIYENPRYSSELIFTGGTCLRKVYNINRLSEDLDFDCVNSVDLTQLCVDLEKMFKNKYGFDKISSNVRSTNNQATLKFNILKELGFATDVESPLLFLKLDIQPVGSFNYTLQTQLLTDFDFNYIAKFYDLPTLFSGKILAILNRTLLWGNENMETIKGRDYFDLLWFLSKKIKPNLSRLPDFRNLREVFAEIDIKVAGACGKYKEDFRRDLTPFINNTGVLGDYIESYKVNYEALRDELLILG